MNASVKYLPTKISLKKIIFVIILLSAMYIIDNSSVTSYLGNFIYSNVIEPLLWIGISIILWKMPHIKATAKLRHRRFIYFWACNFGLIYIFITIFAGFLDGLGKSPYSHSLQGVITNLISVGTALVAREFIRSYLVNSFTKKESYFAFIAIAFLITITNFSVNKYMELDSLESAVKFIAEYFAPEFSHNIFASYLVYLGGPLTSIIYLGIIQTFHWFSPILPSLEWIITALTGILSPAFFLMFFKLIYSNHAKEVNIREQDDEDLVNWIITSVFSIAIIWFAAGVFSVYPSVIATGSMEPEIKPGDVILVEKITDMEGIENLNINDVIQFQRDGILISHRIIEIKKSEENGLLFKTKGDNNSGPDVDLVKPQDIKGTIKYTVPKIGWLTLLIKSNKEITLDDIVF
ncbi:MAG: signal peptidase I [Sedimentibacter sp.]